MNRDPYIPYRPFKRAEGVLARIDENGDELRVHRDEGGRWHPIRWRVDAMSHDGWCGAAAYGFTAPDFEMMRVAVG